MFQQFSTSDRDGDSAETDALLLQAGANERRELQTRALFPSHLRLLTPGCVLPRECLPNLENAQAVLAAAQQSADLIVERAQQQAEDIRRNSEIEGQRWLETKRDELLAEMYFQQALWLSRLQPVWLEALENTLRKVVGKAVRPDAFACAISLGLKEFKEEADLQLFVHPDDVQTAEQALTQLAKMPSLIVVNADEALSPGTCQLRSTDVEVSLRLNDALDLALGKL